MGCGMTDIAKIITDLAESNVKAHEGAADVMNELNALNGKLQAEVSELNPPLAGSGRR